MSIQSMKLRVLMLAVGIGAVACGSASESLTPTSTTVRLTAPDITTPAGPASSLDSAISAALAQATTTTTASDPALPFRFRILAANSCADLDKIGSDLAVAVRDQGLDADALFATIDEQREGLGCGPAPAVATSPSTSVGGSIETRPGLTTTTLSDEALAYVARVDAATTCVELKQISVDIATAFRDSGFDPDLVAITLNEKREAIGCVPAVSLDPADPEGTIEVIRTLTDCLQILAVEQEALTLSLDGLNQRDSATFDLYNKFTTAAAAQFEARCRG